MLTSFLSILYMKIAILLFPLFSALTSSAQSLPFPDSCNTVLWGAVNAHGDTSYILGTCHIFGNTFVDGYVPIKDKYSQAKCIVVERTDINVVTKKSNWLKKVSAKDRRLIKGYLKQTTPSFYLTSSTKSPPAWLYYVMLAELALRECNTYNENDVCNMDEYIANGATTFNKKLYGLEEKDDTLKTALFAHIGLSNDEDAIAKIKDMIINNDHYKDTVRKWCNCGEMDGYRNLTINYKFSKSSIEDDSTNSIVVDQRNDRWMPALKAIIDGNKAFIAVGLGHLYYNKGLIVQLVNSRYTVFPVAMYNTGPVKYLHKKRQD